MSGEINRVPVGLLSALDLKSRGQAPRILSGNLQAVYEAHELYELGRERTLTAATAAVNTVGPFTTSSIQVPQGEFWHVTLIAAFQNTALAAGTTYRWSVGLRRIIGTIPYVFPLSDPQSFTAGEAPYVGWNGSLWMRPTDQIAVIASQVVLGTAAVANLLIDYTPYSV